MSKQSLPTVDILHKLLRYDALTGKLFWKVRPAQMFAFVGYAKYWNKRYAGEEAFTSTTHGYRQGRIFKCKHYAHRVIWAMEKGVWPTNSIDHINHNGVDNCISNLREATSTVNNRNHPRPLNNLSGYVGVHWNELDERWVAQIGVDGKSIHLGSFTDLEEAASVRKSANITYGYHDNHGNSNK